MGCASETHFPCRGKTLALWLLNNQPISYIRHTINEVIKPTPLAPPDGLEQLREGKIRRSITRVKGGFAVVHL